MALRRLRQKVVVLIWESNFIVHIEESYDNVAMQSTIVCLMYVFTMDRMERVLHYKGYKDMNLAETTSSLPQKPLYGPIKF